MTTEIVAYQQTEAVIADLTARYAKVVFDVTKPDGMKDAKSAYKEINTHSITLEAARVKEKAESLAYGRRIDSEAKRIADQLDGLRLPIKSMIETETKREQRELEEKTRLAREAEEKRLADERTDIERRQAAIDKAEREARDKIEADQRAARLKIEQQERDARLAREEADRKARQAIEAVEAEAKVKREAEEARLKAERDKLEAAQRAADAKARQERDAEEAKQREIQRKKSQSLDGRALLNDFYTRFGSLPEFKGIADKIADFLQSVKVPA